MKHDYMIVNDVVIITVVHGERVETITMDIDTFELILENEWNIYVEKTGYVKLHKTANGKYVFRDFLHRVVVNFPKKGLHVDHIDHNPRNNTRANLRVITHKENMRHRKGAYSNSKSGVRGVSWDKTKQRWKVNVGGKYIGRYKTIEEAEEVALKTRAEMFGEYA